MRTTSLFFSEGMKFPCKYARATRDLCGANIQILLVGNPVPSSLLPVQLELNRS